MINYGYIILGSLFVIVSFVMFGRHIEAKSNISTNGLDSKIVLEQIKKIEKTINEMNESFYSICSELEGNYSVHDKEIQLIYEEIDKLKKSSDNVKKVQKKLKKDIRDEIITKDNPKTKKYNKIDEEIQTIENKEKVENITMSEKIKYLHKIGKNPNEIAKTLNIGIGEVQLFINLKK